MSIFEFFCSRDCLTEYAAAGCLEQMLAALQYLHDCKIAHLSIKVRPRGVAKGCGQYYDVVQWTWC